MAAKNSRAAETPMSKAFSRRRWCSAQMVATDAAAAWATASTASAAGILGDGGAAVRRSRTASRESPRHLRVCSYLLHYASNLPFFFSLFLSPLNSHCEEARLSHSARAASPAGHGGPAADARSGTGSREWRIVVAVVVGALLGGACALLYPGGFSSSDLSPAAPGSDSSYPALRWRKVGSNDCMTSARYHKLKKDVGVLESENAELKKQVTELTLKLQLAAQGKEVTLDKAGPFGTVKALRTNPTVIPAESVNPRLAKLLSEVAVNREIIVALANSHVLTMLEVWFSNIQLVGIPNYLVVALDEDIENFCKVHGVPVYRRDPEEGIDAIGQAGSNHEVSGLKFHILREFLQLGYSVFLSDVDILFFQNPFDHLYRDSDVESMSDGHDNMTAYGYDDVFDEPAMGWARYAHTMRIWVYNSGFFFLRPTVPAIELLDRVAGRLSREKAWDQAVFNEELAIPSHPHPGYDGLYASRRTMDIFLFMNSKVLFKTVRKDPELLKVKPVVVHLNYHPDKEERMRAVIELNVHGKVDALDHFPDGSER